MSRSENLLTALNATAKAVLERKLSALVGKDDVQGAVPAARTIWGYSAAYKLCGDKRALMMATRAMDHFLECFLDHKFGGVYASLNAQDERLDTDKKTDIMAAAVFALSEYASATGDQDALRQAENLFEMIERSMACNGTYVEVKSRDWSEVEGENPQKLATLLHVLEGYTNLYKVTRSAKVRASVEALLDKLPELAPSLLTNYGHWFSLAWQYVYTAMMLKDVDLVNKLRTAAHECMRSGCRALDEQTDVPQLWIEGEQMIASFFMWKYNACDKAADKAIAAWERLQKDYPTMQDDLYHTCRMTYLVNELFGC